MPIAILITGGNLGDRLALLKEAESQLEFRLGKILAASPVFESEAWGFTSEENFLNQVLVIETVHEPHKLLEFIRHTEYELGRKREAGEGYLSRTMDIDLLFYNQLILEEGELLLPHPRLHLRKFVLMPLRTLDPGLQHPKLKKTVWELYRECEDSGMVREYLGN